mmetsp:Transcript_19537/g.31831  ORF Transcript_19537/g.31831 Transcript_19537/m.31831 type:complete len:114 (-) Transcript_19537:1215-1556(-)
MISHSSKTAMTKTVSDLEPEPEWRRRNGWHAPNTRQQIIAITFIFGNAGLFYGLVFPFRPESMYNIYLIPYTILTGICLSLFIHVETVDPIRKWETQEENNCTATPTRSMVLI